MERLRRRDVQVEQTRHRQVDRLDFPQRDAVVEAAKLGQIVFGERQRRRVAQPRPRLSIEVEIRPFGDPGRDGHRAIRVDRTLLLEGVGVALDVVLPLVRDFIERENRFDRTRRHAGSAVDALVRMDVEHRRRFEPGLVFPRVDAVNRTDVHARAVLGADAGLGNHVGHVAVILPFGTAGGPNHWPALPPRPQNDADDPTDVRRDCHGRRARRLQRAGAPGTLAPAGRDERGDDYVSRGESQDGVDCARSAGALHQQRQPCAQHRVRSASRPRRMSGDRSGRLSRSWPAARDGQLRHRAELRIPRPRPAEHDRTAGADSDPVSLVLVHASADLLAEPAGLARTARAADTAGTSRPCSGADTRGC